LLILVIVSVVSYQDWVVFQRSAPQVQHGRALLEQVEQVLSYTKDAETGQRGYVLTGNSQYLAGYNAAVAALPSELEKLRQLVAEDAPLRTRVATLDGLVSEKLAELQETVALRENEGFNAALSVVETNRGQQAMDEIRKLGADLQNEVYRGLQQGIRERQDEGSRARLVSIFGGAVLFVFLLLATVDIGRANAERDRLIVDLQAANDRTTASRDLLHTTLTSIGDAVIATDDAGRVTFMNGVAEELTGWNQAEAAGQPLENVFAIVNEDTRQPAPNPSLKALREGTIAGLANHTVLISRDGSERPIDDSAAPIRDPQGKVIGAVLVFRDISERRHTEEETRRLNHALVRTNQDLQQFAYAASHD
jgi:PAS domain S-box-containing protein